MLTGSLKYISFPWNLPWSHDSVAHVSYNYTYSKVFLTFSIAEETNIYFLIYGLIFDLIFLLEKSQVFCFLLDVKISLFGYLWACSFKVQHDQRNEWNRNPPRKCHEMFDNERVKTGCVIGNER